MPQCAFACNRQNLSMTHTPAASTATASENTPSPARKRSRRPLTFYILWALILGIVAGYACNLQIRDEAQLAQAAGYVSLAADIFLRLIKMIIAPLVFSTLVVGIAHMGDSSAVGRIGGKALLWFVICSAASLGLGMVLANLLQPGHNIGLPLPAEDTAVNLKTSTLGLRTFLLHLVPDSIIQAMASNEILQVVVFSLFFGTALAGMGEKGRRLAGVIDELAHVVLRITGSIMNLAPIAVFAAVAAIVATQGLSILFTFARFMGSFYLALLLLWALLIFVGWLVLGRSVFQLIKLLREPFMLSFSTASSEAAYPKMLEALDKFGVRRRISSFVLPLGYSFNLDAFSIYITLAAVFIAQATNTPITMVDLMTILAVSLVTSKGAHGVPGSAIVVLAATLQAIPAIPAIGLVLVLSVDWFMGIARALGNLIGNCVATVAIAAWDGDIDRQRAHEVLNANPELADDLAKSVEVEVKA